MVSLSKKERRYIVLAGFVSLTIAVALGASLALLSEKSEDKDLGADPSPTEPVDGPLFTINSQNGSSNGLDRLKELAAKIPVFAPSYLPSNLKLDPVSIKSQTFKGSDTCSFTLRHGIATLDFRFNFKLPWQGLAQKNEMTIRGQKALVYSSVDDRGVADPFEKSKFYAVFWQEGKDLTGAADIEQNGANSAVAKNINWTEMEKIVNNLAPVNESGAFIPEINGLEDAGDIANLSNLLIVNDFMGVLIPSKIPSGIKYATCLSKAATGNSSNSYSLEFSSKNETQLHFASNGQLAMVDLSLLIRGYKLDSSHNCDKSNHESSQQINVNGYAAYFSKAQGNSGYNSLIWCTAQEMYDMLSAKNLDEMLEIAKSMKPMNEVLSINDDRSPPY